MFRGFDAVRLGSRDPLLPDPAAPSAPKQLVPIALGTGTRCGTAGSEDAAAAIIPPATGIPLATKGAAAVGEWGGQAGNPAESRWKRPFATSTPAFAVPRADEPAIALIESASIAVGFLVADEIVKKAPVRLLRVQTASPGKFLVLYTGDVASMEEAHKAGLAAVADSLLDELLLPHAHPTVLPALEGLTREATLNSFAVIETFSFAAAIVAADVAVKAAPVDLIEIRPPVGMGGKSFLTLTGDLGDLQFAVAEALDRIRPGGKICRHVLIPNPHGDLNPFVF